MKFQKQLFRHDPERGVYGDCYRTVLACFLDLDHDQVPHFAALYWNDSTAWAKAAKEFLAQYGLVEISVVYDGSMSLDSLLSWVGWANPGMYYMLSGRSRNGTDHVVIGLNGSIVWDPATDDSGIVGPGSDGYYRIDYLGSTRLMVKGGVPCPSIA